MSVPASFDPTSSGPPSPRPGNFFASFSLSDALVLVLAVCTIAVTFEVFKISGLADDIRNTNTRIDQIWPDLNKQTSALGEINGKLGSINGSLEVSSQKIATVAEKLSGLTDRLTASITSQEAQNRNVQDLSSSVSKLVSVVQSNQQKLDLIENSISGIKSLMPLKKTNFLDGMVVFSTESQSKILTDFITANRNTKVISVDWGDAALQEKFFGAAKDAKVDFSKFVLTTKDQEAATTLSGALAKAGIQKFP